MLFGILRILMLVVFFVIIFSVLWPRLQKYKQGNTQTIDVEAEVVRSEQHKPSDIPKSPTTSAPYTTDSTDSANTKEQ